MAMATVTKDELNDILQKDLERKFEWLEKYKAFEVTLNEMTEIKQEGMGESADRDQLDAAIATVVKLRANAYHHITK